jgi:hypothetical protein
MSALLEDVPVQTVPIEVPAEAAPPAAVKIEGAVKYDGRFPGCLKGQSNLREIRAGVYKENDRSMRAVWTQNSFVGRRESSRPGFARPGWRMARWQ